MKRLPLIILLISGLISACQPGLPQLPPDEIVNRAAQSMLSVDSMHFKIEVSGVPVYLNRATALSLRSVEGDFARPDRMGVHLKVIAAVAAAEMDMIAIGNEQYITNILNGKWEVLPPEFGFNPAVMFDPKVGIEKTLEGGLDNAQVLGTEAIDGAAAYHLKGSIDGARVQGMSSGLITTGRIEVELWVDGSSFLLKRLILIDTGSDPQKPSTWTMTFSSFGQPVNINAPTVGQ
jgi:hypothetical protein